jgi:hypothetical protein
MIIGSYHKTGTLLFKSIWEDYSKKTKQKYKFYDHFNDVSDKLINNTKCIVIIRHPLEIIMSGVRYHQITHEKWCNIKNEKYNGVTYKEYIKNLNNDDKITFEMNNCTKTTIDNIYNDMKYRNINNNILFIRLEDLYDKNNIPFLCEKIKTHCSETYDIDNIKLTDSFFKCLQKSYHRTNKNNNYTYKSSFKEKHITYFKKIFPSDIFEIMGYKVV